MKRDKNSPATSVEEDDALRAEFENEIRLLQGLSRRTTPPPRPPAPAGKQAARVALASSLVAIILVVPLYFRGPFRAPEPRQVPDPTFAAADFLRYDARMRWQSQERLLTLFTHEAFDGRDGFIQGSLASSAYEAALAERVAIALAEPATVPMAGQFDETILLYGLQLQRRLEAGGNILPVNGMLLPPAADDSAGPGAAAYFYAQSAVQRLRELYRWPAGADLDAAARQILVEKVLERPQDPWPEALRQALSALSPGTRLLVVEVKPDASLTAGTIHFTLLDARAARRQLADEVTFTNTVPPLALRRSFPRDDDRRGHVEIRPGAPGSDEIIIVFRGTVDARDGRVSFISSEGLRLEAWPAQCRAAEIRLEARTEFRGGGSAPTVQFLSGGDDALFPAGAPPQALGRNWQSVTIPLDLSQARVWKTGLTVASGILSPDDELRVHIRNQYIRPLGAAPSAPPAGDPSGRPAGAARAQEQR